MVVFEWILWKSMEAAQKEGSRFQKEREYQLSPNALETWGVLRSVCSSNATNYSWIPRWVPLCHSLLALECHGGRDTLGMFQILPGQREALWTPFWKLVFGVLDTNTEMSAPKARAGASIERCVSWGLCVTRYNFMDKTFAGESPRVEILEHQFDTTYLGNIDN